MQAYSYDLSKLAGKKVEIRFVFDSDGGGNATGVTVQNITLSH
jgi:bacillopeptidase F (M6 metalloprotease family)